MRIAPSGTQPLNAVAMHVPHGSGIEIGPDGLRAMLVLHLPEAGGDCRQRLVPRDTLPLPCPLWTSASQGMCQPLRMMDALGIARDFLADHAGGVGVFLGAAHPADRAVSEDVDIQRTDRGAVVRANGTDGTLGDRCV